MINIDMFNKEQLYIIPNKWDRKEEYSEIILQNNNMRIERIISCGHISAEEFWYDQDEDEWVAVIQGEGEVLFADGEKVRLSDNEGVFIPAYAKHKVSYTSKDPLCIWLAIFTAMEQ